jgi:hypothetical protein
MRAVILTTGLILGSTSALVAMPVTAPPLSSSAIQIHGCHHYYGHDLTGWHRGVVGGKNRNPAKS